MGYEKHSFEVLREKIDTGRAGLGGEGGSRIWSKMRQKNSIKAALNSSLKPGDWQNDQEGHQKRGVMEDVATREKLNYYQQEKYATGELISGIIPWGGIDDRKDVQDHFWQLLQCFRKKKVLT